MPQTLRRRIDAAERTVLDFHYKKDFEERISSLEAFQTLTEATIAVIQGNVASNLARIVTLEGLTVETFAFTVTAGIESDPIVLAHDYYGNREPIVTLNGVLQRKTTDYTLVDSRTIQFTEVLVAGDVVIVVLTY